MKEASKLLFKAVRNTACVVVGTGVIAAGGTIIMVFALGIPDMIKIAVKHSDVTVSTAIGSIVIYESLKCCIRGTNNIIANLNKKDEQLFR